MGLFSRKKKSDRDEARAAEPPVDDAAETGDPEATPEAPAQPAADDAPEVNISFSAFRGVGAQSGPEVDAPGERPATPQKADPAAGPHSTTRRPDGAPAPAPTPPEDAPAPAPRELPLAPAAPPQDLETVKGLRDNALLRDALQALPETPTPQQLLGVARQMLQGHVYLRVAGDVREQVVDGRATLTFGVAKTGDKSYMMVFSSGRALREAVKADGDEKTSAVAQPVATIVQHMVDNGFDGIIVDNASAPKRIVLPREMLEKAMSQADPGLRLKTLIAQPRDTETPGKVAALLAERPPLWVAVGTSSSDDQKMGIAEARLANGTRLLQVFSHPLEVVATGREERALPFGVEKIAKVLVDHPAIGGLLIDPAGPLMTLTREELEPVIALADGDDAAGTEPTA
ncbi:SseB family protein [Microbacterium sp. gxy059]|uniref:SseB family protein n=1 Tax=Microbacterium sp. gxy059 TaxID=2957199 RepID=UPI003D950C53